MPYMRLSGSAMQLGPELVSTKSPFVAANVNETLAPLQVGYVGKGNQAAAVDAVSDIRKFTDYIFKPDADHGKDAVFKSLGYTADDSVELSTLWQQQAVDKYAQGDFKLGKADQYGQRVDIEIALPGKGVEAGKVSYLRSGWMIQADGSLKLNTPFSGFTRKQE
jgi:filamentous hemagglutinin